MRSFYCIIILFISVAAAAQSRRVVIAHRGDHTEAPENTMKAYENAIANQVDYVEVDLRTTNDGKLVIMHDETVDRMTNGKGKVSTLNLDELLQLEVTDKQNLTFGIHKVPQFEEVLNLCKGKVGVYLDFKEADPKQAWSLIKKNKMERYVVVYVNSQDQFKQWKTIAPYLPLMVSLPDSIASVEGLSEFIKVIDPDILDGGIENYTTEMVRYALKKKKEVWLDFQQPNEGPLHWKLGVQLGIQGFQTDKPKELKKWLSNLRD